MQVRLTVSRQFHGVHCVRNTAIGTKWEARGTGINYADSRVATLVYRDNEQAVVSFVRYYSDNMRTE